MKRRELARRLAAAAAAISLFVTAFTGCGGLKATTMSLVKSEGSIEVRDGNNKDVEPRDDLKLYSGYGVETAKESYAWIDLDDVKLVKMDVKSEIEIQKEGGDLEIVLQKGSLFFNITEPLTDEESMTIRTSTIAVGIRGTCGWVDASDKGNTRVYILEGRVRCKGSGVESVYVDAGEKAVLVKGADEIVVSPMTAADIPAFVVKELEEDEALQARVESASGIDVSNLSDPSGSSGPLSDALAAYRTVLGQAASYFQDGDYNDFYVASGNYTYALVRMQTGNELPALLLQQEFDDYGATRYLSYVFQYDPGVGQPVQAGGMLSAGAASAGGYRGSFDAAADGNGILESSFHSGSGQGSTSRVTLVDYALYWTPLWDGNVFEDQDPYANSSVPIDWHDISDLSGLDGWTPIASSSAVQPPATQLPAAGEDWQSSYISLLDQIRRSPGVGTPQEYYLYDIDKDGAPELIVAYYDTHSYESGTLIQVYTYKGTLAALVHTSGTDTLPMEYERMWTFPGQNGILLCGEMFRGLFSVTVGRIENGKLVTEELGNFGRDDVYGENSNIYKYAPGTDVIVHANIDDFDPILSYTAPAEPAQPAQTAQGTSEWQDAYIALLEAVRTKNQETDLDVVDKATGYRLYDIDKDGIPELIVEYTAGIYFTAHASVYTVQNGAAVMLTDFNTAYDRFYSYPGQNGMLVVTSSRGGGDTLSYYSLEGGQLVRNAVDTATDPAVYAPGSEMLDNCSINDNDLILSYQ